MLSWRRAIGVILEPADRHTGERRLLYRDVQNKQGVIRGIQSYAPVQVSGDRRSNRGGGIDSFLCEATFGSEPSTEVWQGNQMAGSVIN